jgi:hypothetical protein
VTDGRAQFTQRRVCCRAAAPEQVFHEAFQLETDQLLLESVDGSADRCELDENLSIRRTRHSS